MTLIPRSADDRKVVNQAEGGEEGLQRAEEKFI